MMEQYRVLDEEIFYIIGPIFQTPRSTANIKEIS